MIPLTTVRSVVATSIPMMPGSNNLLNARLALFGSKYRTLTPSLLMIYASNYIMAIFPI